MYKAVFGWLKKGNAPDEAGCKALYALMLPTIKMLKLKRLGAKNQDLRLVEAFPVFYEFYTLLSSKPEEYWKGVDGSFAEVKALRSLRKEVRKVWKSLFSTQKKEA